MPTNFSGSLQPKKKNELQSLATALGLKTEGTKEELHTRLRNYLDKHQSELEEQPQFSGLFDKRRRRKESVPPPSKRSTADSTSERSNGRRIVSMESVLESTPAKDLSDVSAFLKNPKSPLDESSPRRRTRSSFVIAESPSSEPPDILERSIVEHIPTPRVDGLLQVAKQKQEIAVQNVNRVLFTTRTLLSDSRTIGSVAALAQLLYIVLSIVPWQYLHIPFSASSTPAASDIPPSTVIPLSGSSHSWNFLSVTIPYPPLATFQSRMFWTILMHWFIPTILVPLLAGILISFKPAPPTVPSAPPIILSESREISRIVRGREQNDEEEEEEMIQVQPEKSKLSVPFDPLTASIIQLAAQVAYSFPTYGSFALTSSTSPTIKSVDVLGFRWRVLSASVGLAFSFAEAIMIHGAKPIGRPLGDGSSEPPRSLELHRTIETIVDSEVD